jgi:DNA-binding PadR family transcriptional regulator
MFNRDLSKGSAELLVLTLLEARARHGYDLGKLIEQRSKGQIRFRIGSLYPILFRLEDRRAVAGEVRRAPPPLLPADARGPRILKSPARRLG